MNSEAYGSFNLTGSDASSEKGVNTGETELANIEENGGDEAKVHK